MQSLVSSFWMFNYIPKHSIDRLHTLGPRTDPFDEGRPLPHRHSPVESGTVPEVFPITRLQKERRAKAFTVVSVSDGSVKNITVSVKYFATRYRCRSVKNITVSVKALTRLRSVMR